MYGRTQLHVVAIACIVGLVLLSAVTARTRVATSAGAEGAVVCGPRPFLWESVVGKPFTCDGSAGQWLRLR